MLVRPPSQNPSRLIALVEDDPDDARIFEVLLRKTGGDFALEVFRRGQELIAAFGQLLKKTAAAMPLVCFLDLTLPDSHGLDLLKWIRSQPRLDRVSVVVLSASENPEDIKRASGFGAQCYLAKYPQPAVLRRVIAEATELAGGAPAQHWFGLPENLILRWAPSSGPIGNRSGA